MRGVLASLVVVTGCLPTGGPPDGSLRGTHAGHSIDLTLDADSQYWLQRRTSCATQNQDMFALHYGGEIEIYFQIDGGSTILGDRTFEVPQPAGSDLVWFSVTPKSPAVTSATVVATISGLITTRRTGTITMKLDDGGMLEADYSMPYEVHGERTHCGDGFDGPDD